MTSASCVAPNDVPFQKIQVSLASDRTFSRFDAIANEFGEPDQAVPIPPSPRSKLSSVLTEGKLAGGQGNRGQRPPAEVVEHSVRRGQQP